MSELKNRALAKKFDEFMSQPFNQDDCTNLKFSRFYDGYGMVSGNLTFMFRDLTKQFFVCHQGLSIKTLDNPTRKQVDEVYYFFTGEHLDFMPTKVYNWETCFSGKGWYIDNLSRVKDIDSLPSFLHNSHTYPTQEDAESALAHCQLLHIVNTINADYPRTGHTYLQVYRSNQTIHYTHVPNDTDFYGLQINTEEAAKVLIRDNEQILKTYFKIK